MEMETSLCINVTQYRNSISGDMKYWWLFKEELYESLMADYHWSCNVVRNKAFMMLWGNELLNPSVTEADLTRVYMLMAWQTMPCDSFY